MNIPIILKFCLVGKTDHDTAQKPQVNLSNTLLLQTHLYTWRFQTHLKSQKHHSWQPIKGHARNCMFNKWCF